MARGKWVYSPSGSTPAKITVSDAVKTEVAAKANELIENVLKPTHIKPPPEGISINYIADIYGKWYQRYFYFCST